MNKCLSYRNCSKCNGDHKGGRPLEDPLVDGRKDGHCASLQELEILDEKLVNIFGTISDETSRAHSWAGTNLAAFHQGRLRLEFCANALKLQILICRLCPAILQTHIFVHIYCGRHGMAGTGVPRYEVHVDIGKRNGSGCIGGHA